jgi:hypothetical protein
MVSRPREATFYVQVQRNNYYRNGRGHNARALTMTRQRPETVAPNCVVVELTVRIPDEAFEPIKPTAVIDVPIELVQRQVDVVAGDAS